MLCSDRALSNDVVAADERGDGAEAFGLSKLFADPNLLGKLATNPRTQKHLADPSFVQKLQMIQLNRMEVWTVFGALRRSVLVRNEFATVPNDALRISLAGRES